MQRLVKNSIAILGAAAMAFAINAQAIGLGALQRLREENSGLQRVAHATHGTLNCIPGKSSRLSRGKRCQLPQNAIEPRKAISLANALRSVGTAFCAVCSECLLGAHVVSSRAPPLA